MEREQPTGGRLCLPNAATWIGLLFLGVRLAAPPAAGQEAPAGVTMHRQQAGAPNARGWYYAKSTDGHFSVSLPLPFNDFTVRAREKDGTEVPAYVVGTTSTEGVKFSATEMPKGRVARDFDFNSYVQKFKADRNNKVSNETRFEFDGHPALQFHVANARQSAVMRAVVVPSGVLLLIVEYPTSLEKKAVPLGQDFFDSLRIEPTQ